MQKDSEAFETNESVRVNCERSLDHLFDHIHGVIDEFLSAHFARVLLLFVAHAVDLHNPVQNTHTPVHFVLNILFFFRFEGGAWCVSRSHQKALRCLLDISLLLFLNRKTEKNIARKESERLFPLLLPWHLPHPPTPHFHARATATTATRGCTSSRRAVARKKAPPARGGLRFLADLKGIIFIFSLILFG
jgi:hypothetical protein